MRLGNGSAILALSATGLLVAGSALANTPCPPGSVVQNDACGGVDPDPNGGCNFAPANFQDLGLLTTSITICGTVGTVLPTARDLDWYTFELNVPSRVQVTTSKAPGLFTIFVRNGFDCNTAVTVFAAQATSTPELVLPAGTHTLIFTVNAFAPDGPVCGVDPNGYTATVAVTGTLDPACGGTESCVEVHASGGCSNLACCDTVCQFDPSCCDSSWTSDCVDLAVQLCGLFVYVCNSPGGAPANDCATSPATIACGATAVAFNTTFAGTDGPPNTQCAYGKDIWYITQFNEVGGGELEVVVNTPGWDSTIALYALGASPAFDPSDLPNLFIGCVDIFAAGGEGLVLIDAAEGEYYLIQVAGFDPGTGPEFGTGDINVACRRLIANTGNTRPVQFDATNQGNFAGLTNLGLSSGFLNAANPQRWYATPITISDPGPGLDWLVTSINVYGFSPAGVQNDALEWKIWCRTDLLQPPTTLPAEYEGAQVPFPTPYDIAGGAANENHEIVINQVIPAGDYWLTVYASNNTGGALPSNFAWFINPPDGIPIFGPNGVQGWRSVTFPPPPGGFVTYQLPPTTLQQQAGLDPNDIYGVGYRILGSKQPGGATNPCSVAPPCPWDLSGDGVVDGADLGILLGGWGVFNGADLGQLLGSWGPCPTS
ncbi:MAG TPA: PPC domain-containing protein [Phycisphaerales bacterium]|nr:PPC domain-containing protein [Phycisphaerales bacterium]HMP37576.1 PPC domain-containing protein [Phycisphaerales bacterium]